MNTPIETERKFLIRIPDVAYLSSIEGARVMKMEQTYLLTDGKTNARVRKIDENGSIRFIKTVKQRISTLSCYESETEISAAEYNEELKSADTTKKAIIKTRYAFPFDKHTVEIDVYPFWNDRAILEIEMTSEDEMITLPAFIEIIKEVSEDGRYKNTNLAKSIPLDTI